jgi:hypothetical protein
MGGTTGPNLRNTETVQRTFDQTFEGMRTRFSLGIPKGLFNYYEARTRTGDYGAYVSDKFDDRYVGAIADEIENYGQRFDLSKPGIVNAAVAIVQGMEYTEDSVTTGYDEYPRYPVETLYHQGGDCEDTAILLAQLLRQLGYGVVLFLLPGHMGVGVLGDEGLPGDYVPYKGEPYYYVETTGDGWRIGEMPEEYRDAEVEVVEINAQPSLICTYGVVVPPTGGVQAAIEVRNFGKATANNPGVTFEFQKKDGSAVARKNVSFPNVRPEGKATKEFSLSPPADQALRVKIQLGIDGVLHDELTSEYREP